MIKGTKELHRRDLVGQHVVDYDERVDVDRLRRERIGQIQAELAKKEMGGVLLYDPVNVRYATGTRMAQVVMMRWLGRYCVVPREGDVTLFGSLDGGDLHLKEIEGVKIRPGLVWFPFAAGSYMQEAAQEWARDLRGVLREMGIANERLGIDRFDPLSYYALEAQEIEAVDGQEVMELAHAIKTIDELALIRQACAICDVAIYEVRQAIKPGVTENELFAILAEANFRYGGEHMDARLLSAGGNTNPWYREASDRIVREGDLVAFDTDMAGPMGYFADVSRTYLCGDKPTAEQKEVYKVAYDMIQQSLPLFRPGMSFREIAEKAPPYPEEYKANRYVVLAHGVGMADEWPAIYFVDKSWGGMGNYDGQLEENMVMTVESYAGKEGAREGVKLEEEVIITAGDPEIISLAAQDWRLLE